MRFEPTRFKFVFTVIYTLCLILFFTNAAIAAPFDLSVQASISGPLPGVSVYAFTEAGNYTGLNAATDSSGNAQFTTEDFADGNYRFRVDYLSKQYWSSLVTLPQADTAAVTIDEANVTLTVSDSFAVLAGVNTYIFNGSGSYLNQSADTNGAGQVVFTLPLNLDIKCRADYLGYQFWSETTAVTTGLQISLPIPSHQIDISVQGSYQGQVQPFEGINTYLFKPPSSYLGQVNPVVA